MLQIGLRVSPAQCHVLVRITREGYNAFSRALSFAASSERASTEEAGPVGAGGGRDICVGGVFIGALSGGRLLSDPLMGIGTDEDIAGCNGGLEGEDVKASSYKRENINYPII